MNLFHYWKCKKNRLQADKTKALQIIILVQEPTVNNLQNSVVAFPPNKREKA